MVRPSIATARPVSKSASGIDSWHRSQKRISMAVGRVRLIRMVTSRAAARLREAVRRAGDLLGGGAALGLIELGADLVLVVRPPLEDLAAHLPPLRRARLRREVEVAVGDQAQGLVGLL